MVAQLPSLPTFAHVNGTRSVGFNVVSFEAGAHPEGRTGPDADSRCSGTRRRTRGRRKSLLSGSRSSNARYGSLSSPPRWALRTLERDTNCFPNQARRASKLILRKRDRRAAAFGLQAARLPVGARHPGNSEKPRFRLRPALRPAPASPRRRCRASGSRRDKFFAPRRRTGRPRSRSSSRPPSASAVESARTCAGIGPAVALGAGTAYRRIAARRLRRRRWRGPSSATAGAISARSTLLSPHSGHSTAATRLLLERGAVLEPASNSCLSLHRNW